MQNSTLARRGKPPNESVAIDMGRLALARGIGSAECVRPAFGLARSRGRLVGIILDRAGGAAGDHRLACHPFPERDRERFHGNPRTALVKVKAT